MSNLSIRKKSLNTWLHTDSIFGDFIISKFYFNSYDGQFRIVEEGNSRLVAYEIANITLYDDTNGGTPETFSTITELSLRLEALQYPAFDRTGTTIFPSMEQITNVNVTDIEDNQVLAWDVATSKWVNITIGGLTTPTLQEVTEAGNEIETDINVKSIFFKIGDLDEDNSGTGIAIDNDESSINFFRNLENFMTFNRDVIGGTNSLGSSWNFIFSDLETNVAFKFPNQSGTISLMPFVISSNTTASNDTNYSVVANATFTDPTPVEGKGYMITVINGTATIGGVGYTVGQKVFRHFHSGSWRSFIYGGSGTASTLQEVTEAGDETTIKTIFRTSETEWVEIGGDNNGIAVFNDVFGSLPTPKKIIDVSYNSVFIKTYDTDTGEQTGSAGISDKILRVDEIVGGVQGKSTTIEPDKIVKGIDGSTFFDSFLPSEDNDLNGSKVISANTTASNAINYLAVANLTMTDITPPSEGAFYEVTVINGTATIGGVGYTVGQKVFRHYHSGSWRTFVYLDKSIIDTLLANKIDYLIRDFTFSSVTGVTTETLVESYEITAGKIALNDFLNGFIYTTRTGVSVAYTVTLKANTVNNSSTATTIASLATSGNFVPFFTMKFELTVKGGVIIGAIVDQASGANYRGQTSAINVPFDNSSNSVYLFLFVTPTNTLSVVQLQSFKLTK
jgi:hypothetical protein